MSAESGFWNTIWSARRSFCERFWNRGASSTPVELDGAGGRPDDPEQRPRQRGLAAAGLADEAERLAGPDRGADADERVDVGALLLEDLPQVFEPHDGGRAAVDRGDVDLERLLTRQIAGSILVEAAGAVTGRLLGHLGPLRPAAIVHERAAVGEDAPGDRCPELWEESRDGVQPPGVLADAATRDAAQQADGVRMARVLEDGLDGPFLDEAPPVQHADPVAHLRDHAEVVADEENGRVQLRLQVRDEIEHLRLDRCVEPRGRLVEDQQRGVLGQRHRDHDPLLHPAGELMRIAAHHGVGIRDLHPPEGLARALGRLLLPDAEDGERLRDLRADLHAGVQRRAGVLVDHRHRARVVLAQLAGPEPEHVPAGDRDAARGDPAVARQVADDAERGGRLAAARLSDEPVRLALLDRERHASEDRAVDPADAVDELEVGDVERGGGGDCAHRS